MRVWLWAMGYRLHILYINIFYTTAVTGGTKPFHLWQVQDQWGKNIFQQKVVTFARKISPRISSKNVVSFLTGAKFCQKGIEFLQLYYLFPHLQNRGDSPVY